MHELSIATSLVEAAGEEAAQRGAARVLAVHLRVGALSGVVCDALAFSFEVAAAGTPLEGARLEIEEVPVVVFCPACRAEKPLPDFIRCCPDCGAPTPEVRQGAELEITALELAPSLTPACP